jgi:hypothetical protein
VFRLIAVTLPALSILVAAGLVVGEMRYRDCVHQRELAFKNGWSIAGQAPSYKGCSHSPF